MVSTPLPGFTNNILDPLDLERLTAHKMITDMDIVCSRFHTLHSIRVSSTFIGSAGLRTALREAGQIQYDGRRSRPRCQCAEGYTKLLKRSEKGILGAIFFLGARTGTPSLFSAIKC